MTSSIDVRETKVNDREVIAFRKIYNEEEHEVFAPKDQALQIMFNLLATINDSKDEANQFVLVRKGDLGWGDE